MREEVIQVQELAIRELSTPLFPVAEGVVAMPLLGMIDETCIWPAEVPELREAWSALYRALDQVSTELMRVFALALPAHFFDDKIDRNISCLRALNYPEQLTGPLAGQLSHLATNGPPRASISS